MAAGQGQNTQVFKATLKTGPFAFEASSKHWKIRVEGFEAMAVEQEERSLDEGRFQFEVGRAFRL